MTDYTKQFSLIYDQHVDRIYRFVYLRVDSAELAEDITAKVFLKGWERYKINYSSIGNIGAFLYQIARNTVTDYYRQKGRKKIISADLQIADNRTNIYEKAALSKELDIIKSAIKNINKNYQDVIIWHYIEDMPISSIAEIMNKSQATTRVILHRGLKALRKELGQA